MKRYLVVGRPLFLNKGTLTLTKEQYKPREHALKPIRGNQYEITSEVCFKIGEIIGYSEDADIIVRLGFLELQTEKKKEDLILKDFE